jgi:hypothetical protein
MFNLIRLLSAMPTPRSEGQATAGRGDDLGAVSAMAAGGWLGYAFSAVWSWGGAGDVRARTPEGSGGPAPAGRGR